MPLVSDPNRAGAIRGAKPGNGIFLCSFPRRSMPGPGFMKNFAETCTICTAPVRIFPKIPAAVERKTMSADHSIHALHKLGALSTNSSTYSIARNADDYADPTR